MTSEYLRQLATRLDGQGFEAGIIGDQLFVIAPARVDRDGSRLIDVLAATSRPDEHGCICYRGEARRTEIITCRERAEDGGQLWFFAGDEPLDEASHVTDAAMRIGSRVSRVRVAQ
ncbi:hypothetical protein ACQPZ8_37485 [Actinomadura nitritigenes]|uniref:hypothetical protein n=1 Tax=Actinomadura nitritigenes TaxID=134602 RepID=UPI003D8A1311